MLFKAKNVNFSQCLQQRFNNNNNNNNVYVISQ